MGLFDFFRRRPVAQAPAKQEPQIKEIMVGAKDERERSDFQAYYNGNITFSSGLTGYDYDAILRNKQTNINT